MKKNELKEITSFKALEEVIAPEIEARKQAEAKHSRLKESLEGFQRELEGAEKQFANLVGKMTAMIAEGKSIKAIESEIAEVRQRKIELETIIPDMEMHVSKSKDELGQTQTNLIRVMEIYLPALRESFKAKMGAKLSECLAVWEGYSKELNSFLDSMGYQANQLDLVKRMQFGKLIQFYQHPSITEYERQTDPTRLF